jgi:alpha-mannosidase
MKQIHIILNAHIDPIWLWPWEAGLDEVLATCRAACDRLDANPDIIFTRGEAWAYHQVEMVDPDLFSRMRRHIETGRWEIVGGWWIQPDCNQPSGWAIEKQIEIGKEYFLNSFGQFPRIAYNVDSFGHAATLPALMRQAGQSRYIMMRPEEHEMSIPSSIFRWRGYEDGPEVTTFRIPWGYTTRSLSVDNFSKTVMKLPEGINHTMAFVGVGDHGGGPTQAQIDWCRSNKHIVDGWELVFSSPSRFFDAIESQKYRLPLITGELQMHAIGCYSVYRQVKTELRRAEHLMAQAEVAAADPAAPVDLRDKLKEAWEHVCFHQFHDTLGGTCIPSAYPSVMDQLGSAADIANRLSAYTLRRKLTALPDDRLQRIAVWNAAPDPFQGYTEYEPWFEGFELTNEAALRDEKGEIVPHQLVQQEAATQGLQRLLFKVKLEPGEMQLLRIARSGAQKIDSQTTASSESLSNNDRVSVNDDKLAFPDGVSLKRPQIHLISDNSDTWSHGLDRYSGEVLDMAKWHSRQVVDEGPLMVSWIEIGTIGKKSEIVAEWRVYADEPFIGLDLKIDYRETNAVVKLVADLDGSGETRTDGILGGSLVRKNEGREQIFRDWTHFGNTAIVSPDTYALDVSGNEARLTLLRSPLMAHHDPHPGASEAKRHTYSDQGIHHFRLRFYPGAVTLDQLEAAAHQLTRPPLCANVTKGMPMEPKV